MKRILLLSLLFQSAFGMGPMVYGLQRLFSPKSEQPLDPLQAQETLDRDLSKAAMTGNQELVQSLLAKKANVLASFEGWTALDRAACNGHTLICKILLDAGAPIEKERTGGPIFGQNQSSPLLLAVRNQHLDTTRLFLDRGADVYKGYGDETPLLIAALKGYADVCKLIITHSQFRFNDLAHPNPTAQQIKELTILHLKRLALNASKMTRNPEVLDILDLAKLEEQFGAEIEKNIRASLEHQNE